MLVKRFDYFKVRIWINFTNRMKMKILLFLFLYFYNLGSGYRTNI
jgi:hypothetical protein